MKSLLLNVRYVIKFSQPHEMTILGVKVSSHFGKIIPPLNLCLSADEKHKYCISQLQASHLYICQKCIDLRMLPLRIALKTVAGIDFIPFTLTTWQRLLDKAFTPLRPLTPNYLSLPRSLWWRSLLNALAKLQYIVPTTFSATMVSMHLQNKITTVS